MRTPLVSALCLLSALTASAAQPASLSIFYTGRLFGYFRAPNIQDVGDTACPARVASLSAETFLQQAGKKDPSELRLALGDNFAPEVPAVKILDGNNLNSRILYQPYYLGINTDHAKWILRDKDLPSGGHLYPSRKGMLPSDPVACFLQQAQFEATVPGKDDFYFGPDYVINVARFLHQDHGDLKKVEMLAANLIVTTVERGAAKPLPPDELPANISRALLPPFSSDPDDTMSITMPSDVLPWLRDVKVTIPSSLLKTEIIAELCLASGTDPNECVTGGGKPARLHTSDTDAKRTYSLESHHSAEEGPNFLLLPDRNYAFCLRWPENQPTKSYCKTFTVRQPLLQSVSALQQDPGIPSAIDANSPAPYYVAKDAVVFGVVDQSLMQQVGLLNDSWWNENAKYDTAVKAIEPAKALEQVLAMCDHDQACRGKRKILLAQMSPQKAHELMSAMQKPDAPNIFDVVLTQADQNNFTGTITTTTPQGDHEVDVTGPVFLVPATHYDYPLTKNNLSVKIQRASITFGKTEVTIANTVTKYQLAGQAVPQAEAFKEAVVGKFNALSPDRKLVIAAFQKNVGEVPFESLAMLQMQKYCRSDLALMQPRDVFQKFSVAVSLWSRGEPIPSAVLYSNENLMEEALWKGDVVICRALSGADLKKALKQSEALSDKQLTLSHLGVDKDALHDNYIVDGDAVDDKRLYSVALTDFLAYGDTGYADLNATDVGTADTLRSTKDYKLIAEAAVEALSGTKSIPGVSAENLYDHVDDKPPVTTPRFDELRQFGDWAEHWIRSYPLTPVLKPSKNAADDPLQLQVQHRSYSYLNLEKLTLSYALTAIAGPQQLVPAKFGGISNVPQLQTLESQSVSAWERVRFGHVFASWFDIFGTAETRYGFSRTRQTASASGYDPYKINITENAVQWETGLLSKRVSEHIPFRLLLSERFTTQLRAPLLSYSALAQGAAALQAPSNCKVKSIDATPPVTEATTANVLCAAPRTWLQETKIGTRLENRDNWIEFGWENGHNFNSVTGYVLNKDTSAELDCSATTNQSVTTCIAKAASKAVSALSPLYVTQQTLPVSGLFFNFKMSAPVYGKTVQFSIENYSELFLKHSADTSADTRFYQDTILALPVKIWQNLSISPQVEIFNYQNKVLPQHFFSFSSKLTLDSLLSKLAESAWEPC